VAEPSRVGRRPEAASHGSDDGDRGSAVAEFAMVIALLMLLFLALLQVCLWAYARTLVSAAAAEAARSSALAGATGSDVTQGVADRLGDGIGSGMKSTLSCSSAAGALQVEVHCTMEAPGLVGLLDGVMPTIDVISHAAREPTP
jgi:hypothetical protein